MSVEPDLTVPQVARILRVAPIKIRKWIRDGELAATNTSNSHSRPCFTVTHEALANFRCKRSGKIRTNDLPDVEDLV